MIRTRDVAYASVTPFPVAGDLPQVLIPFHRAEAITVAEAAVLAKRTRRTLRDWCNLHDLGRRIGGQWAVSIVALAMYLDGDSEALAAYLRGDRQSSNVLVYFTRCNVPLFRRAAA
jgi:hypothetical protein